MTCDIIVAAVNNGKPFSAHSLKWSKSVDNFCDSATIKLPTNTMLRKEGYDYEEIPTALKFKEGMTVEIYAGYDGKNERQFKGFIRRINLTTPLEIECEGFSYQLRKKNFSKSYKSGVKLKSLLQDLISGTDIKLSTDIPDEIIYSNLPFSNFRGVDVLEWIKDKMRQTVYFDEDTLFVGLRQTALKGTANFTLGWNVIKDTDLKFNVDKEFAKVKIVIDQPKEKDGTRKKGVKDSKYTDTMVLKVGVRFSQDYLNKIAEEEKTKLVNRGYEGSITAFLKPHTKPGMVANIQDKRYPERTGKYFITGVDGEFGLNGGRQKIKIGNSL